MMTISLEFKDAAFRSNRGLSSYSGNSTSYQTFCLLSSTSIELSVMLSESSSPQITYRVSSRAQLAWPDRAWCIDGTKFQVFLAMSKRSTEDLRMPPLTKTNMSYMLQIAAYSLFSSNLASSLCLKFEKPQFSSTLNLREPYIFTKISLLTCT